jgi:hypothetical protein
MPSLSRTIDILELVELIERVGGLRRRAREQSDSEHYYASSKHGSDQLDPREQTIRLAPANSRNA